ncbi:MAG: PQQ-binding-like beta-propeller repeat protein [Archaeoglobaceae archaeon]
MRLLISRLLCLFAVFFMISVADANMFQGNAEHLGNFTSEKIIPKVEWKTELSGLVGAQPVYIDGKVFVSNWYGWGEWKPGLYAIDAKSGEILWRNETIQGASTPAIYGEKIYIGGMVYSGEGWLYYGYFYILNAKDGRVEKELFLDQQKSYYGIASSPIIYNNSVYVLTHTNGTLWKISLDGDVIAKFSTGGTINPYTSPAASNGKIFFAGNSSGVNKIYCVNENLDELWNASLDSQITNTPTVVDLNGERILIFSTEEKLYIYNESGYIKAEIGMKGSTSSAAVEGDKAFFGSRDGKLYCINLTSFKECWNITANGKIDSSPAIANGVVYFATNTREGTLYAVNASDGKILWTYRLVPPDEYSSYNIMSSPYLADNRLYIGADNGYVYCFTSEGVIEFNVIISPGKYTEIINDKEYKVNKTSVLGALHFASLNSKVDGAFINFSYELSDKWYETYGLLLTSVMGLGENYWIYYLNNEMPLSGINQQEVGDGDIIYLIYGTGSETPENANRMIKINVKVVPVSINSISTNIGQRGGNITVFIDMTAVDGCYVLVVSGTCDGDSIAGISVFNVKGDLKVPVIIPVPQQVKAGKYKLYAGVYYLSNYPENIIIWSDAFEVEVR